MSDNNDKKHEFDGETFKKVIAETMFKCSMSHAASKLIENFEEDQKEKAIVFFKTNTVSHSSVSDFLKSNS